MRLIAAAAQALLELKARNHTESVVNTTHD
jgi:hypothetical protein